MKHCKISFIIDIIRIEFQYHPVDIYSLDLICFKDQQGTLTDTQRLNNVTDLRQALIEDVKDSLTFIIQYSHELQSWLT